MDKERMKTDFLAVKEAVVNMEQAMKEQMDHLLQALDKKEAENQNLSANIGKLQEQSEELLKNIQTLQETYNKGQEEAQILTEKNEEETRRNQTLSEIIKEKDLAIGLLEKQTECLQKHQENQRSQKQRDSLKERGIEEETNNTLTDECKLRRARAKLQLGQKTVFSSRGQDRVPEVKRQSSVVEVKRQSSVVEVKRQSSIPEVKRQSSVVEVERQSSVVEVERQSSIPEVKRQSSVVEVERQSSVVEVERMSALEIERHQELLELFADACNSSGETKKKDEDRLKYLETKKQHKKNKGKAGKRRH
ncbi:hypothetical protein WMY93_011687 [Mugilogobius chulae]|uniref:Uncharacterized protein n=1 Tax=Mugilogobius chulae TaxID=88201 RepID=A0AAW0P6I6_9GOBI